MNMPQAGRTTYLPQPFPKTGQRIRQSRQGGYGSPKKSKIIGFVRKVLLILKFSANYTEIQIFKNFSIVQPAKDDCLIFAGLQRMIPLYKIFNVHKPFLIVNPIVLARGKK